jgi:NADH-quinone oxidoreductase subunit F
MHPRVLLKNRKSGRIATIDEYRQSGGYQALENAFVKNDPSPGDIREILLEARLLGRGGAGFPIGKKMETVPENAPHPRYLVCNADEMEPGTFKDRVLIHADPHQLIEGIVLAARAIAAEIAVIFIRREYENAARILEREIQVAQDAGFAGKNILGSGHDCELIVHRSAGRYICGEGTAVINALEGKRANPRRPPPYPTTSGLWQLPTEVQNVETLCCVPHVISNGAPWFRSLALTESGAGTKVFSVSGRVNHPGCFELPMGIRLSELIEKYAGGMIPDSRFKACMPGGASTRLMPGSMYHLRLDYSEMEENGYRLGTGAIMVFDHKTCLVQVAANLMTFFVRESCGWCTPCREGLPYILDLLNRIEAGQGRAEYIEMIRKMCGHMKYSFCAFAPGAVAPVQALIEDFHAEVTAHIENQGCPFKNRQSDENYAESHH